MSRLPVVSGVARTGGSRPPLPIIAVLWLWIVLAVSGSAAAPAETGPDDFKIILDVDLDPVAAYNTIDHEYLVVCDRDSDKRIRVRRVGADGMTVAGPAMAISDGVPFQDPAVAHDTTHNRYLVVWSANPGGGLEVHGQLLDATGAEIGTDFRISDLGPEGNENYVVGGPDVVYNPSVDGYLVVFYGSDFHPASAAYEIFGQRIDAATGLEVGANDFRISDMGSDDLDDEFRALSPAVAYRSNTDEYLVVWHGNDVATTTPDRAFEIYGQRLDGTTGSELGVNDFRISDAGAVDTDDRFQALSPDVAHDADLDRYLVVWYGDDDVAPLIDNDFEIFGQQLSGAGAEIGTNDFRISDLGPDGNLNWDARLPAVAYLGVAREYLVAWSGRDDLPTLAPNDTQVFGQRLASETAEEIGANDFLFTVPDGSGSGSPVAHVVAGADEYLAVTTSFTGSSFDAIGQRIVPGAGSLYFSADNDANGLQRIFFDTGAVVSAGAGATGVTGSNVGLAPAPDRLYGSLPDALHLIERDGSESNLLVAASANGLAYDAELDELYAARAGDFESLDGTTGASLGPLPLPSADLAALALLPGDAVYGLPADDSGLLHRFDLGTGTWSVVGSTGVALASPGLAADPSGGRLLALGSGDSMLYEIDPTDATTTALEDTGLVSSGGGLALVENVLPEPGAPGSLMAGAALLELLARRRDMARRRGTASGVRPR